MCHTRIFDFFLQRIRTQLSNARDITKETAVTLFGDLQVISSSFSTIKKKETLAYYFNNPQYCVLFIHRSDEDHLIKFWLGWFDFVCPQMTCKANPRLPLVLWQCGQGVVVTVAGLPELFFLACLRCSAAAVLLASQVLEPL